jgi:hypothetical protein
LSCEPQPAGIVLYSHLSRLTAHGPLEHLGGVEDMLLFDDEWGKEADRGAAGGDRQDTV